MSSITAADLKLGGRLTAACDALAANKLRTAAGIFLEVGGDLNLEAENTSGLLAPDDEDWSAPRKPVASPYQTAENLQMCARNVHGWGGIDERGYATCLVCGTVSIMPKDPSSPGGPIDMGSLR